jgi:hypothetical protein
MLFPSLSILLLLRPVAGIAVHIGAQYNAFAVTPHSIIEYLNRSQAINWTEGTAEATGAKYIMTRINMDMWKAAADALGSSLAQPAEAAHLDASDATPVASSAGLLSEKLTFSSHCYHEGVGVAMSEISKNVRHIQDEVLKSGGMESAWYGFDHPSLPDITMWYSTAIYQWIDAVPKNLVVDMYTQLLWAACGPPWKVLGGVESARDSTTYGLVARVEFYAIKE